MTVGELFSTALRMGGVDEIFGVPFAGVHVVEVSDLAVAEVLALAHELVHRRTAFVHAGDGRFVRPNSHGSEGERRLGSVDEICELGGQLLTQPGPDSLSLELDPQAPAVLGKWPDPPEPVGPDDPTDDLHTLIRSSEAPVVLAGPGIFDGGAVADLHALAAVANLGVLNTWGAKGLYDWRSRHHLATVGLQDQDFRLGGLAESDLIIATGLDSHEAPDKRWQISQFCTVATTALARLSETIDRPRGEITQPPLRAGLARVTQLGWKRSDAPLAPTKVTRQYALSLGGSGLVAADAGIAGYWVARTFSTTSAGSAVVPSTPAQGLAVAAVIVARRIQPARLALAVIDGVPDELTLGLLAEASRMGIGVGVEAWVSDGPRLDATAHAERLRRLVVTPAQEVVGLSTDLHQIDQMISVAGPVIAWT